MPLPIRYLKAPPTTYVLQYKRGRLRREGAGLAFFYWVRTSVLVGVPVGSKDLPFAFQEATADFQTVTVQGQLTYRVVDPKRLAALLDYSLDARGQHASEDPDKLDERLLAILQTRVRSQLAGRDLRASLAATESLGGEVHASLRGAEEVKTLGLEVLGLQILGVRPTPEAARALEAETREALQRRSDEAIYARRRAAVEEERKIKESELETEKAVEEKRRLIRETQMQADIAIEMQRAALIDQRVENERKDADAKAHAIRVVVAPLAELDWRKLMLLVPQGDARQSIAMAFQELAANAQRIGELNMSPDLLRSLLGK